MAQRTCTIDGCDSKLVARGYCNAHYQRHRLYGDPLRGKPRDNAPTDHEDGTRTCRECGERKPLDQYGRDKTATLGRRSQCNPCRSALVSTWYAANQERQLAKHQARVAADRDRVRQQDRERYSRHRDKRMQMVIDNAHVRRARMSERPSDTGITVLRLRKRDGGLCCYCGCAMVFARAGVDTYVPERATLEHVLPVSRGGSHTWDNVALACRRCNTRKQARTVEEWRAVCPELPAFVLNLVAPEWLQTGVAVSTPDRTREPAATTERTTSDEPRTCAS